MQQNAEDGAEDEDRRVRQTRIGHGLEIDGRAFCQQKARDSGHITQKSIARDLPARAKRGRAVQTIGRRRPADTHLGIRHAIRFDRAREFDFAFN